MTRLETLKQWLDENLKDGSFCILRVEDLNPMFLEMNTEKLVNAHFRKELLKLVLENTELFDSKAEAFFDEIISQNYYWLQNPFAKKALVSILNKFDFPQLAKRL